MLFVQPKREVAPILCWLLAMATAASDSEPLTRRIRALRQAEGRNQGEKLELIQRVRSQDESTTTLSFDASSLDHSRYSPFAVGDKSFRDLAHKKSQNGRRSLQTTGHLSDLLIDGCTASNVYQYSDYDNEYAPACACWQDLLTGEILLRCHVNDDDCQTVDVPEELNLNFTNAALQQEVCSATQEFFFFSDTDGDLETKATCQFCRDTDDATEELCAYHIRELCTFVTFAHDTEDNNDQPVACELAEYLANQTEPRILCQECEICEDGPEGPYGIQHSCFDLSDGISCETSGLAHLHNFVPTLGNGSAAVFEVTQGRYADICQDPDDTEFSLTNAMYDKVGYDNALAKVCDCNTGTNPSITCDLHNPQCFANTCSDMSEVFFFDNNGAYSSKWTVSWGAQFEGSDLWTQVRFNKETGEPTECGVIDLINGQPYICDNCELCSSGTNVGLNFNCFGQSTSGCYLGQGRAQYNFAETTPFTPRPSGSPPTVSPPTTSPGGDGDQLVENNDNDDGFLGLSTSFVVSSVIIIVVIVATFVVVYLQHVKRREARAQTNLGAGGANDEMTVASSVPDEDDNMSLAQSEDNFVNNDIPPPDNTHEPVSAIATASDESRTGGGGLSEAQIC
mmetsp:Transcript_24589/g.56361  ORF Transcript_24589/g.56361 Transcript_24589/m.56361 type:complete len:624 (+) Transcript_24589:187-2058(+)